MKEEISIRLLEDRVLAEPSPAEERTAGGLIIPATAQEKSQKGRVLAVGPGKEGKTLTVQVGDNVVFDKYSGREFRHNGKEYLIMREADISAVLP